MEPYTTRVFTSEHDMGEITEPWARLRRSCCDPHIEHHPEWLHLQARERRNDGSPVKNGRMVIGLYRGGELVGVAPMLLYPSHLRAAVAKIPIRRAVLCGSSLLGASDAEACEAFLRALVHADAPYDMLTIETLRVDSPLWTLLRGSGPARDRFWVDAPPSAGVIWALRLPASFDAYLSSMSGDTRRNLRARVRRLENAPSGPLRLDRITSRADLRACYERIERISARSWKTARLGLAFRAEVHGPVAEAYADLGWLRGYLMSAGEEPIAFLMGCQESDTFYGYTTAYDPDWARYGPGTVMFYRIIQDLYAWQTPSVYEMGYGDNEYKRIFCNSTCEVIPVSLIRKGVSMGLRWGIKRACDRGSLVARATLERLHLHDAIRRLFHQGRIRAGGPRPAPAHHE